MNTRCICVYIVALNKYSSHDRIDDCNCFVKKAGTLHEKMDGCKHLIKKKQYN